MDRERSWSAGIILLVSALVIAFGLGGCQAIDRFVSMKADFKAKETGLAAKEQEKSPSLTPEQVIPVETKEQPIAAGQEQTLTLYFADPKGQNLISEKRVIAKTGSVARAAIQELIKGPNIQSKGIPTIPAGTRLLDINVKEGLCTVNFSKELQKNHQGGSAGETMTVYSIVNTLTQYPSIEKVQILVEGKKIESLAGHMDVSQAMARKKSMIMDEAEPAKATGSSATQGDPNSMMNSDKKIQ
ncbi:hypothetical protein GJ688_06660 [Heliobacillus mobilis]|uniref:GerMN domain-containing protein n=1 Tax=Heliobacterium mobile TaxID=28064 RepID=A0A6I3SIE7_HELMO|nr:GerMN domain-containing protein [Heliobacterium mobile]MTV48661.1 hypothetical protein [Heliobacterium mobile]